jgi:hypothetical protein
MCCIWGRSTTVSAAWLESFEAFDETRGAQRKLRYFPTDRAVPEHAEEYGVQMKLKEFTLRRPRQWGACWAFCRLWALLGMEEFWQPRLADPREGTSWYHVLMLQVEGHALPVLGPIVAAQGCAAAVFKGSLAGFIRRKLRCAAV